MDLPSDHLRLQRYNRLTIEQVAEVLSRANLAGLYPR